VCDEGFVLNTNVKFEVSTGELLSCFLLMEELGLNITHDTTQECFQQNLHVKASYVSELYSLRTRLNVECLS
jgi:hypothetical protein